MNPLEDRVCPRCRVLLREGARVCVKCGRWVEPEKTGLEWYDAVRRIHPFLVQNLGWFGGNLVAAAILMLLLLLTIAGHLGLKWLLKY
jgi:RNA polymerase subunit RPABC4/transcription elongation factor Spt4